MKSSVVSKSIFNGSAPYAPALFFKKACRVLLVSLAATFTAIPAAFAAQYAGIVVDAKTGKVLYSENADSLRYPASLTKMMTLYLTFEALEAGKINENTPVPFSKNASAEPPSKLGVRSGNSITVEQAILSMVTRSANDSSTALGELLGGSEERFARIMTNKARALGMTRTTYRNANGLPNDAQMTTARDQARLGMALRQHFPQYYSYFSTRSFRFGKQTIGNHNRLLGNVRGVDGIKTGYTRAAGFNLVTSAQADGRSIVGVVMGGKSGGARDAQMRALVAKYMPAASRRGGGNLVAETADAPTMQTAQAVAQPVETAVAATGGSFNLPSNGPVPDFRYSGETTKSIEVAYAAPVKASANPLLTQKVMPNTLEAQSRKLAKAAPVPAADVDNQITNSVAKPAAETAAVADNVPAGWVIQIGATPDKAQAMTLLDNAKDKGGKALRGATPFTVAFASGDSQLYRARFGGFSDQNKAVSACKTLKSKGFACWASAQ
ncbi:D-alanyl-D-alanine carboxypeptidase [Rhizobium sp. Root73]|uniref:D-alanyl-D-alanine carboxypeptidase n=1 Tax=unclassified Rhizobium TaxID=2613769 RepID=UPI000714CCAA|nr:D-alanyl-D-alanine carboxypeptidase [Rhizobium sp. Root73]KQV30928.1 D-alanyl-D-alanine carboxypeptidase [Rhizobium sp. Root1204]KQY11064.1 D-alanyl-D-alanine carboxypeptidase [Rhizobium sp. Root1334]KRC05045.1 D-alanyl-D-alanine carboxypeptidase [Rhizobium sp. Root73]